MKPTISPLAESLNQAIASANPNLFPLLSELGKKLFFPKGILTQAAEADAKAHRHNATLGIATEKGFSMHLQNMAKHFNNLEPDEVFPYASSFGVAGLRQAWKERLLKSFDDAPSISLPVATSGLTHGLSIAADLFVDAGDQLITADQIWGNYKLIFETQHNAHLKFFPFYSEGAFNLAGLEAALKAEAGRSGSVKLLLNLPNNPTGYQVSNEEAMRLKEMLFGLADSGVPTLVLLDDAYLGFTYEANAYPKSLFNLLVEPPENLLAVNISGVSKELFAWGFRLAFITFALKGATEDAQKLAYHALEAKAAGALRSSVSSVAMPTQQLALKLLQEASFADEWQAHYNTLKRRYEAVKKALQQKHYKNAFAPYPFNSGYFMLLRLNDKLDAESIRKQLLDQEGIGVVSIGKNNLRIAFSSVEEENLEDLFERLYKVCNNALTAT